MRIKNLLLFGLLACLFLTSLPVTAQKKSKDNKLSKELDDIRYSDLRNFGVIIENEITVGYYMFTRVEKTGGGMAQFKIEIFDENLKSKKSIKLERKKKSQLVEMHYNGSAFFLMLSVGKGVDMLTYDKEGKLLGEINLKKVSKWERMRVNQAMVSEEGSNASVYSTSDKGFIRQALVKNKKVGYVIEAYNNKLKLLWSYESEKTSKKVEAADIMYASGQYVALLRSEKKSLMAKDIDNHVVMLDAEDGKQVFEIPMKEISDLSVLGCDVDEEKKEVILNGEYFAKGKNISNSKSEGLYLMLLDLEGKELKMEKLSWKKELISLTTTDEEKGKSKENMRFFIHKVFIGANGNTYVIAEQYRKILSGTAIAMKVLGGVNNNNNLSNFSIQIYNMVYMVFDPQFKLIEKEVIKKKFQEIWLPKDYEYASPTLIAQYIKANGYFDYQFSTSNKEKGGFTSYYIDLNRKGSDGKKNDCVLGTISLIDGKIETKRTPINTDYSRLFFMPAKESSVLIGEYWRSKRKMLLRIESVQ